MWVADEACCIFSRTQLLRHGDRVLHELAGIRRDGHPYGELPVDAHARLDPYPGERGDNTSARVLYRLFTWRRRGYLPFSGSYTAIMARYVVALALTTSI